MDHRARTPSPPGRHGLPFLQTSSLSMALGMALISGCAEVDTRSPGLAPDTAWGSIPVDAKDVDRPGSDLDGDGVTDDRERAMRSNPELVDTDGDGFPDGFEDRLADFGFRITVPDADRDRDGLTDEREARLGTRADSPDSDGDSWGDFDEQLNRLYGFDPVRKTGDRDFDGLADEFERSLGSSPDSVDSNGDGVGDFLAFNADQPPAGPKLEGALGEMIGITYSMAMAKALEETRRNPAFVFPAELARELPYPDATAQVLGTAIRPSAALMQRSLFNPHNSPGLYPTYAEIEQDLYALASKYNGANGPDLVRLFYWTGQTVENCEAGQENRPGRRIYAMKVSANPGQNDPEPEVAFMGVHHARELITATQTMRLLHTLTDDYGSDNQIRKLVDNAEIWVIPVVNPNGYDRAISNQVDWRKNTRLENEKQKNCGTDLNRNYGFGHVTQFPPAQRAALPDVGLSGVDPNTGNLDPDSFTYPGPAEFSEVETQAVRGLAHSQFLTERRKEVDGLVCALSWHSFGGVVGHPMGHPPQAPATGLDPADVTPFGHLTNDMANAANYLDVKDGYPSLTNVDGCLYPGYNVYGDSNDWFYKDGDTFAVLIESYSVAERGGCPVGSTPYMFYPQDAITRDKVAEANVEAALAMIRICPP